MTTAADTSVRLSTLVEAPAERAFAVFTQEMSTWWPKEHHLLEGELAEIVVEPQAGGRIYDRASDGREMTWSRVLVYDPPKQFVFSWDISLSWEIETDPAKCSEVAVTFVADGPSRTRVTLEHRELQRHGEGWEQMRAAVGGDRGWAVGFGAFAAVFAS